MSGSDPSDLNESRGGNVAPTATMPAQQAAGRRRLRWLWLAIAVVCAAAGLALTLQGLSHAGGLYWYAHYPRGVTPDRPQGLPTPAEYQLTLTNFAIVGGTNALAALLLLGWAFAWQRRGMLSPRQPRRRDAFAGDAEGFQMPALGDAEGAAASSDEPNDA